MWLFYQDEEIVDDEKDALMRAMRQGRIEEAQSFSIDEEIWSGPQLFEYDDLRAASTGVSDTTVKNKGVWIESTGVSTIDHVETIE